MSEKPVIVIGNGGHARVLTEILKLQKREIIGFTAPASELNPYGISYIGNDDSIFNYHPNDVYLVNAIGSIRDTKRRKTIFEKFKHKGYSFSDVIHPNAIIANTVTLGEGVQIMAGSVIQPFVKIADNTIVNTLVSIDHDCMIGQHCHIAPGCVLSGEVVVNDGTHIGTGTTIIQKIQIGKNVLIGAGSLVLKHVSDNKKTYGIPAKDVSE